jgi:hypothetical protein
MGNSYYGAVRRSPSRAGGERSAKQPAVFDMLNPQPWAKASDGIAHGGSAVFFLPHCRLLDMPRALRRLGQTNIGDS